MLAGQTQAGLTWEKILVKSHLNGITNQCMIRGNWMILNRQGLLTELNQGWMF